jgi:quinol-cytochrome oxidoreductase complex cytochrome b subunit
LRSLNVTLSLFAVLVLSGLLLMLVYVPSAAPVRSAAAPTAPLPWGYLLRGVHFWTGNLVVLAVLAHLLYTIFVKTNWSHVGWAAALFLLAGLLWITGILLPWDQLAFWIQHLWLPNISAWNALWAVYVMHSLILSLLMLPFLLIYARRTRRLPVEPA